MIDFISDSDTGLKGASQFKKHAGGAAANVAVQIKKLGGEASYVGKIGDDYFGEFLMDSLKTYDVNTKGVIKDPVRRTTLAFVGLDKNHIPEYLFYRTGGASETIAPDEINVEHLKESCMIYTSSLMLTIPSVRETTVWIMDKCRELGVKTSFDMNFRKTAWKDEDEAREVISKFIPKIDILKINDVEAEFLYPGCSDMEKAMDKLEADYPKLSLTIITCGDKGSIIRDNAGRRYHFGTPDVKAVDTTGAGDSYMGALLYMYANTENPMDNIEKIGKFASGAASLTVTRPGVIDALPVLKEVEGL